MNNSPQRIMTIYGTRPEAIKMAPIVRALEADADFEPIVAVTGQHREMLDQVNAVFGITPDVDLDIHHSGQTLEQVTARVLDGVKGILAERRADAVVVQGDTTTTFAAALAGFYAQVPVVHVEAGLRTFNRYSPFPEEINRRMTTQLSTLHLAPTNTSRDNLLAEGVAHPDIVVTGNTVIDALHLAIGVARGTGEPRLDELLADPSRRVVLVTSHRRESWGEPMRGLARALVTLAGMMPDTIFAFPIHRNPVVREAIAPIVSGVRNIVVTEPLTYAPFCHLMQRSCLVLTDSGGVQEEAPSLGKPVLVLRENTERPEAVLAGTVRLIGTDESAIVLNVRELLTDDAAYRRMSDAVNPYGDGAAARRTVEALRHTMLDGPRPSEFHPEERLTADVA